MTITRVQESTIGLAESAVQVTKAFAGNVTNGNVVFIKSGRNSGTPFVAGDCTKSSGSATLGTITLDKAGTSNSCGCAVWSAPVTGTGNLTMAVAGPSGSFYFMDVAEASGVDTSGSRVADANASFSNTGTTPGVTGNATSTGEAIFYSVIAVDTDNASSGLTVGNSFTPLAASTNGSADQVGETDLRIVLSGTTTQGTWAIPTTSEHSWAACVVAYKAAGGGGAIVPGPYFERLVGAM